MILVYTKEDLINLAVKNMVNEGWCINAETPSSFHWKVDVDTQDVRLEVTIPKEGKQ